MTFGAVAVGVGSAVAGAAVSSALAPSGNSSASTAQASAQADPFASQRAQYQTMLQNLVTNPSSVTSTPGYQFNLQQGEAAVNGGEAASGYLNSGNRGTALANFGQGLATSTYNNQFLQLSQLAGANIGNPGEAGQITASQAGQNQQAASALGSTVSSALGSAGNSFINGSGANPFQGNAVNEPSNFSFGQTAQQAASPSAAFSSMVNPDGSTSYGV